MSIWSSVPEASLPAGALELNAYRPDATVCVNGHPFRSEADCVLPEEWDYFLCRRCVDALSATQAPQRIRRRREKDWRMPEGAVYVGRGSKWGNPFRLGDKLTGLCRVPAALEEGRPWEYEGRISADGNSHAYFHPGGQVTHCDVRYMTRDELVELYRRCLVGDVPPAIRAAYGKRNPVEVTADDVRRELAGKTLACWCHVDDPCHADVLLEIANGGTS